MSRHRIFVAAVTALLVIAVAVVFALAPRNETRAPINRFVQPGSVALVVVTLDGLDATRGLFKVRLSISGDEQPPPPQGATFVSDLPTVGAINLPIDTITADKTSEVLVDSGDLSEYPFDTYQDTFVMTVFPGRNLDVTKETTEKPLPFSVVIVNALPGFDARVDYKAQPKSGSFTVHMERKTPSVVWASAMIGFYWLLAISAFAVMLSTVLGLREFETRHLAWLVAMIFAFAAFRNTAPGSPPIGVFLDFASFFWAEFLVALSLVAMVVYYLTGDRGAPKKLPGAVESVGVTDTPAPEAGGNRDNYGRDLTQVEGRSGVIG